jgi:hypothetical protein
VRGRGRHGSRKDQTDLRQGLQQARVTVAAPDHTRAHSLGHRPVSDLQGCEFARWSFAALIDSFSELIPASCSRALSALFSVASVDCSHRRLELSEPRAKSW